jgi:plastocyanin
MKRYTLAAVLTILTTLAFSNKVTITNSGFTFSPAEVTINFGDTVVFELASMHDAIEVNEATWNANGNTPLPGFQVPFGGGTVTGLSAGVHFFVCEPHASLGMKGKITVNAPSGVPVAEPFDNNFAIYPNPVVDKLNLKNIMTRSSSGFSYRVEVYNMLGGKVIDLKDMDLQNIVVLDLASVPSGQYILRVSDNKHIFTRKFLKD